MWKEEAIYPRRAINIPDNIESIPSFQSRVSNLMSPTFSLRPSDHLKLEGNCFKTSNQLLLIENLPFK